MYILFLLNRKEKQNYILCEMKTSLCHYFDNRPKGLMNFNLQNVDNKIQNEIKMSLYYGNIH